MTSARSRIGAALGVMAVIVRQEVVALVMGGIFVLETVSVILQVASFKLTGRRIFRMAPHASPLRAEGLGGAEGHRPVLDHLADPRSRWAGDSETAVNCQHEHAARVKTSSAVIVGLGKTGFSCARYLHGARLARSP